MPQYAVYGVFRVYDGANGTKTKNSNVNYWLPWHGVMSKTFHFDGNLFCLCANITQSHGNANHFSFSRETKHMYKRKKHCFRYANCKRVRHQPTAISLTYPHIEILVREKTLSTKNSPAFIYFISIKQTKVERWTLNNFLHHSRN